MKNRCLLAILFITFLVPLNVLGTVLSPSSSDHYCSGSISVELKKDSDGEHSKSCNCTGGCSCTTSATGGSNNQHYKASASVTSSNTCSGKLTLKVDEGGPGKVASADVREKWSNKDPKPREVLAGEANRSCITTLNYYFEKCEDTNDPNIKICSNMHTRCGSNGPPHPPSCWRKAWKDENGEEHYDYHWGQNPGGGYQEQSNLNSDQCKLKPSYCKDKDFANKINVSKTCENKIDTDVLETGIYCKEYDTYFYSITCSESYALEYNPKLRNETNNALISLKLKPGQGFGYTINLSDKNKCIGEFDHEKWKSVYDNAKKLYARAQQVNDLSEIAWFKNKLKEVINYIIVYNAWKPDEKATIDGEINIKYKERGDTNLRNHKEKFNSSYIDTTEDKETECKKISYVDVDSGLAKKVEVCSFTWEIVAKYLAEPPHVYVDTVTGKVSKTEMDTTIDGGKNFYISVDAVSGKGTISTKIVAKKPDGNEYTINNDDCSLEIIEDNDVYRIINDTNPFVYSGRDIGVNWRSSKMDFTNIVDKKYLITNSGNDYLYEFILSRKNISDIKTYNKKKKNTYSKTCGLGSMTGIMKKVCDIIG